MASSIQERGRIVYVEPNRFHGMDKEEVLNNVVPYPYEDYNMIVDLLIETRSKYSYNFSDNPTLNKELGRRYYAHFIGGHSGDDNSTWYLSTDYTDLSERTLKKGENRESIGITDIRINYRAWGMPEVKISFVDIRGASFMIPNEYGYKTQLVYDQQRKTYNRRMDATSGSFFASLLSSPPPIFYLRVKGFYGDGVTFKLCIIKSTISFDQEHGNFKIDCDFIGYQYGILTDIPFIYCYLSPKTKKGRDIWNVKKYKFTDQKVTLKNNKNKEELTYTSVDIPTIDKFNERVNNIENNGLKAFSTHKEVEYYNKLIGKLKSLSSIIKNFPFNDSNIGYSDKEGYIGAYLMTTGSIDDKYYSKLLEKLDSFNKLLSEYNKNYDNEISFGKSLNELIESHKTDNKLKSDLIVKVSVVDGKGVNDSIDGNLDFNFVKEHSVLTEIYENAVKSLPDGFNLHVIYFKTNTDYMTSLKMKLNDLLCEIKNACKAVDSAAVKMIESELGFNPSLKNVNEIVLSHYDCFIVLFLQYLEEIYSQSLNGERSAKKYIRSVDDCDINSTLDCQMPPFTLFTKIINTSDGVKKVAVFPTEYNKSLKDMPEVSFVTEILDAAGCNGVYSNDDKVGTIYEGGGYDSSSIKEPPSIMCIDEDTYANFYPTTLYDLINGGENPYLFIKSEVLLEELNSWIYSTFMSRNYYFEETIARCYEGDDEELLNCAKNFAAVEAANTYIALNGKYTFNQLFPNGKYDSKAYKFNLETDDNFFTSNGNKYGWVYDNDGDLYLPIGRFDEESIYRYNQFGKSDDDIAGYFYNFDDTRKNMATYGITTFDMLDDINAAYNDKNLQQSDATEIDCNYIFYPDCVGNKPLYPEWMFEDSASTNTFDKLTSDNFINKCCNVNDGYSRIADVSNCKIKDGKVDIQNVQYYSIFNSSLYYINSGLTARAYLFVMSIVTEEYVGFSSGIDVNIARTYIDALIEGAYYWRAETLEKTGKDPIETMGLLCSAKFIPRRLASDYTEFMMIGDWEVYTEPELTTNSLRKEELINMFEEFVSEKFLTIDAYFSLKNSEKKYSLSVEDFENFDSIQISDNGEIYNINKRPNEGSNKKTVSKVNGVYYVDSGVNTLNHSSELGKAANKLLFEILTKVMYVVNPLVDYDADKLEIRDTLKRGAVNLRVYAWNEYYACLQKLYGENNKKEKGADNNIEKENDDKLNGYSDLDLSKNDDIRLNVYLQLKNLYEKWMCNSSASEWIYFKKDGNKYIESPDSQFKFDYIDSYHSYIGDQIMLTIEDVSNILKSVSDGFQGGSVNACSLYSLLGTFAEKCGCVLFSLPFLFGQTTDMKELTSIFEVKTLNSIEFKDRTSFVFMYTYMPSMHLDRKSAGEFGNDGFDIADSLGNISPLLPAKLADEPFYKEGSSEIRKIPAFGITYGMQNQNYFNRISLGTNMPNGGATEWVINAMVNIAGKASESQVKNGYQGQNLYKIYSNYSYKCDVEMMGDAMISPLMYFQLNNVPMWKGAYQISTVSHSIGPGRFVTSFSGYRVSKVLNRIIKPLPVSSTLRDYDKTGINKDKKHTQNLKINDDGTVSKNSSPKSSTKSRGGSSSKSRSSSSSGMDSKKLIDFFFNDMMPNVGVWSQTANSNGELNGKYYSHIYGYLLAKLFDDYKNADSSQLEAFKNANIADNKLKNVVSGKCWLTANLGASYLSFSYIKPSVHIYENFLKTNLNNRSIILNKSDIKLSELKSILSNESNFRDEDLVLYWYEFKTTSKDIQSGSMPFIDSNKNLPGHVQIYYKHDGCNWICSEKKQTKSFYYDSMMFDESNCWNIRVFRK